MHQEFDEYEDDSNDEGWKAILRAIFLIKQKKKKSYPEDYIA